MRCRAISWSLLWVLACVAISLSAAASPAGAARFDAQERGVFSRSYVVHSPGFAGEIRAGESRGLGPFQRLESTNAVLLPSIGTATAWLDSNIALRGARARGGAISVLYVPEPDRLAETPADALFELHFEAVADDPFQVRGHVDAVSFGGEAFAAVEIVNVGSGAVVFEAEAKAGSHRLFDATGHLPAGNYRLTAFALSDGNIRGDLRQPASALPQPASIASFEAALFVPEPAAATATRLALAMLALCATINARKCERRWGQR